MRNAVVFITGSGGSGTGFFAKHKGKIFLFTNIHVLMSQSRITIKDHQGNLYSPVSLEAAVDRDIMRITVKEPPRAFFAITAPDVHSDIKVLGNPQGSGVLREVKGNVIGTGPLNIETDAPFVQGHSGSPFIDQNWEVIGIATYVSQANEDWINSETPFSQVRRYGYRIDNITKWLPVNKKLFAKQAFLLEKRRQEIMDLYAVLDKWVEDPYWGTITSLTISPTADKWIAKHNDTVAHWNKKLALYRNNEQLADELAAQMQSDLKTEAQALKNEVKKIITSRNTKWHLPFFKQYWQANCAYAAILNKLIAIVEQASLEVEPVQAI